MMLDVFSEPLCPSQLGNAWAERSWSWWARPSWVLVLCSRPLRMVSHRCSLDGLLQGKKIVLFLFDTWQPGWFSLQHRKRDQHVHGPYLADGDSPATMERKTGPCRNGYEHIWICAGQLDQLWLVFLWRSYSMAISPSLSVFFHYHLILDCAVASWISKVSGSLCYEFPGMLGINNEVDGSFLMTAQLKQLKYWHVLKINPSTTHLSQRFAKRSNTVSTTSVRTKRNGETFSYARGTRIPRPSAGLS